MGEYLDMLHSQNLYYVPIVDAGVARRTWGNYSSYIDGHEQGVFLTINNGTEFVGYVWPNDAVYPDLTNPKGIKYWKD